MGFLTLFFLWITIKEKLNTLPWKEYWPPRRYMPVKSCYRCNTSEAEAVKLWPCKSGLPAIWQAGLGQVAMEYWSDGLK